MSIDPAVLRPFLGQLETVRSHAQSVRSAVDAITSPSADADALLFSAGMDASFVGSELRTAARLAAPRDAALGALDLARASDTRLAGALDDLRASLDAAGGATDGPDVVRAADGVRRAADRLVRWDLEELARTAREADPAGYGVADDLGHWTSFDTLAARELGDAASLVRDDTHQLLRQLDGIGDDVDDHGDDALEALDDEILIDDAARRLDDVTTPAHLEMLANRGGRTIEARAANAMDEIAPDVHAAGTPALRQTPGGILVGGSDELLDAVPADGDQVATMVLRGEGDQVAELPLIATGRTLRFPTRESAVSVLTRDDTSAWVLSPERSGGWRAIEAVNRGDEAARAVLESVTDETLDVAGIRGTNAAIRGLVVRGVDQGLRQDDVAAASMSMSFERFTGLGPTVRTVFPGGSSGLPEAGTPLVSVDVRSGWLRGAGSVDLASGVGIGRAVDGSHAEAHAAFRREVSRGGEPLAQVLLQVDVGRYAIVQVEGAAVKQLQRAITSGDGAPRMLDPRVQSIAVGSNRGAVGYDFASGSRFTI